MTTTPFYLNKAYWTALVAVIFTTLAGVGALPTGLTEGYVNEIISTVLTLAATVLGVRTPYEAPAA